MQKFTLKKPQRNHSRGFTLVEILIVIAIIATLATVAIGNLGGIFSGQQGKAASLFINQTAKLVFTSYKLDVGSYPTTEQGIKALLQAPSGKEGNGMALTLMTYQKTHGATRTNTDSQELKISINPVVMIFGHLGKTG